MENEDKNDNEFKRILQCPLCSKIPLIGLSMDEQSNTFIQTFCKGNGTEIHCCYISIERFMNSIGKGIKTIHKCAGCNCVLGDSLYCISCKKSFCPDDGLIHKISKDCLSPTKRLLEYKQFELDCVNHKFEIYNAYCLDCQKNICDECKIDECKEHNTKSFKDYLNEINNGQEKNIDTFKSLFENAETKIKEDFNKIEYNEKEKWKNKFLKDNQFIINLYEHIYQNYKFLEKINYYDSNVCDNFTRFQNFSVKPYISDPTNSKSSFEAYLKGRDTKYDLSQIYLNFVELIKYKKPEEEIKLFKEDIYQDGKFLGLFDPACLPIISEKPYKLDDDNNTERRIVGQYFWDAGDYYIGLWDEQNLFHSYGEYYFNIGDNKYDRYLGEFKNGEMDGIGIYIWSDNDEYYYGQWKKDKKDGKGYYVWADGYIYEGLFKENKKNDKNGYLYYNTILNNDIDYINFNMNYNGKDDIYSNFYYYKGEFKDDYREGQGEILYKDNTKYIGQFEKCQKNGKGKMYQLIKDEKDPTKLKSTMIHEGEWVNNEYVNNTG